MHRRLDGEGLSSSKRIQKLQPKATLYESRLATESLSLTPIFLSPDRDNAMNEASHQSFNESNGVRRRLASQFVSGPI